MGKFIIALCALISVSQARAASLNDITDFGCVGREAYFFTKVVTPDQKASAELDIVQQISATEFKVWSHASGENAILTVTTPIHSADFMEQNDGHGCHEAKGPAFEAVMSNYLGTQNLELFCAKTISQVCRAGRM